MPTTIIVKNNGSLRLEGDIELVDANRNKFDLGGRTAISLCRCGFSKDKPFCDGSHREHKFQSEIAARVLPPLPSKP